MRRRAFILGVAASWAPLASAQAQGAPPVIGMLAHATVDGFKFTDQWFREGLAKGGIAVGRDVAIAYALTDGSAERLRELADDLVKRKVALVATTGDAAAQAAKAATSSIPVVFAVGTDPVAQGLVASLNRPGGNLTGLTNLNFELGPKRLEVMHELLARGMSIALLVNPASSFTPASVRDAQAAARLVGRELHVVEASTVAEIDTALARVSQLSSGGLLINADAFFNNRSEQLARAALQRRIPAVYSNREFVRAGGIVSYGTDLKDLFHQQGLWAARILKGESPATLPVQQAAKIDMVVNLKTAEALGLTVPQHLLARADEVIE